MTSCVRRPLEPIDDPRSCAAPAEVRAGRHYRRRRSAWDDRRSRRRGRCGPTTAPQTMLAQTMVAQMMFAQTMVAQMMFAQMMFAQMMFAQMIFAQMISAGSRRRALPSGCGRCGPCPIGTGAGRDGNRSPRRSRTRSPACSSEVAGSPARAHRCQRRSHAGRSTRRRRSRRPRDEIGSGRGRVRSKPSSTPRAHRASARPIHADGIARPKGMRPRAGVRSASASPLRVRSSRARWRREVRARRRTTAEGRRTER
jgi:hypothetical protein